MKAMPAHLQKVMEAVKGMDDVPAPVQVIIDGTEGQDQPLIIPADHQRVQPIEGVPVAASRFAAAMVKNTSMKKSQLFMNLYWFLLVASVMIVTNHVFPGGGDTAAAVPGKSLMITPALANFIVLLCSICLIVRAMK